MSQLYYYDEAGNKIPTTAQELKSMALRGVINKNTVVETEDGKRARAEKVNGIVFPEEAKSDPLPFPSPTPKAAEEQRQESFASQTAPPVFCKQCGAKLQENQSFCSSCGARQDGASVPLPATSAGGANVGGKKYNKTTAGILAILFGSIGIHKFYLGSWGWGILFIVGLFLCMGIVTPICGLVEGIIYLTMDDQRFDAKYNMTPSAPFRW